MKQLILHFMRGWELSDSLIFKKSATNQACFVRDTICTNLLKVHGYVISTHTSKSCLLPVYFITLRNGIRLIMRCNFYDWKVSVEIPTYKDPLPKNYLPEDCMSNNMTNGKAEKIPSCYLEGFHEDWCYDAYDPEKPPRKFTIEVPSNEQLYVIIHYLKHAYSDIEFDIGVDTRTVDGLTESINTILENNGNKEMMSPDSGVGYEREMMSAWEILWLTYRKIDSLKYDKGWNRNKEIDFPCICEEPEKYAEMIIKHPEVHKEFLMEELMYNARP